MISSIYVLIVSLLIFIFSFLTSKWAQLQMDIFTGAVGLLVTIAATMEIMLGSQGIVDIQSKVSVNIGEYIILLVILHIAFGIFITSSFHSYRSNLAKLTANKSVKNRVLVYFPICAFGYSISLLASATLYSGNISIINNHAQLLRIITDESASRGAGWEILKIIFLPDYMDPLYYPVFLLFAIFLCSIVLACRLFSLKLMDNKLDHGNLELKH